MHETKKIKYFNYISRISVDLFWLQPGIYQIKLVRSIYVTVTDYLSGKVVEKFIKTFKCLITSSSYKCHDFEDAILIERVIFILTIVKLRVIYINK